MEKDPVTFKDEPDKPAPAANPSAPPAPAVGPIDKPAVIAAAVEPAPVVKSPPVKTRAAAVVAPASRFCFTLLEMAKWTF
jgi:hypothetical protein